MDGIVKGFKSIIGDVEMAPYKIIADRGGYEERLYPAKQWVCSSKESESRSFVNTTQVRLLFNYISGRNAQNIRIDVTSPVATCIEPGVASSENSRFTVGFFIPEAYQNIPPDPVDEVIFIENRPELKVFARIFGGYVNDDIILKERTRLSEALKMGAENDIASDQFYVVEYDPTYKPFNRRNEIWYIENTKDTASDGNL